MSREYSSPRLRARNCNRKWGRAARHSKANKEARLVGREVCFISEAGSLAGEGQRPVQRPTPPTDNQWARAFIDAGRGLHAETAQSALTVILTLVIGGLIGIILIVLITVHLQFHSQFVPISLSPVLRTVEAYVMATIWVSCS